MNLNFDKEEPLINLEYIWETLEPYRDSDVEEYAHDPFITYAGVPLSTLKNLLSSPELIKGLPQVMDIEDSFISLKEEFQDDEDLAGATLITDDSRYKFESPFKEITCDIYVFRSSDIALIGAVCFITADTLDPDAVQELDDMVREELPLADSDLEEDHFTFLIDIGELREW